MQLRVSRIWDEAESIKGFELTHPERSSLPAFEAGAHISLTLPGGMVRQYSLCNDPAEISRYELGILRAANGRGGSAYLHDHVGVGSLIDVEAPRNAFRLGETGAQYILIAGGIGITPLLSMARRLNALKRPYHLYYLSRTPTAAGYCGTLRESDFVGHVTIIHHEGDPRRRLDIRGLLSEPQPNCRLYCCGPTRLTEEVLSAASHWPAGSVHFEAFNPAEPPSRKAQTADRAFEVELARSGKVIAVSSTETILTALRRAGVSMPSACEAGICGACMVDVLKGTPEHRDQILNEDERLRCMTVCCSRSTSERIVLDL